ncbi:MAG: heparinase II/III family protein, partial [Candidatus Cloacimonetes bacterium]|nr:heparinase II/III family protein [Candidatus Cloacimonadota bacterium]
MENDLFDWNITRLWWVDGLIDFMSGSDGIYSEGVFYSEIVSILNSFFTAQKRLYGVNNFERPEMKALYTESLHLLTPEFHFVTFDDAFLGHVLDNNGNTNVLSFSEVISYYNQGNPTAEEKAEIEWIVCGYFQEYSEYPKYWQARTRLYTYNSDCNGAFTTMPSVPQSIAQGSYDGNSEFTIMRPEINDLNEFKNSTYLFVNHENSAPYSSHEHSDQSSFVLYYKGKQLLIDPGYLPARKSYFLAKEWLASPYAHNLIMVNPQCNNDYENVEDELFYDYTNIRNSLYNWNDSTCTDPNYYNFNYYSFEPVGRCYYPYPDLPSSQYSVGLPDSPLIPKNPAFRNYLIDNDNVQHLQVEIEYDHPQAGETYSNYNGNPNDIINIKRNFYGLNFNEGNEYFIIYDNLESSDQSNPNVFMNQLHFGLFRPGIMEDQITGIDDIISSNGIFEYTMYDNSANLFGAMGALSGNSNRTLRDSLPQGLYVGKNWGINEDDPLPPAWEHKCLRINTETAGDEKFLTLLIPSEDSDNPI